MDTLKNALEEYKKAIQNQFEEEKTKEYSVFLLNPSRAKLRKLCLERMKNNTNLDDLRSFNLFLGFEFSLSSLNKLKSSDNKFRPIETFFKKETDLSDLEAINLAAILVDFDQRPFNKFSKLKGNHVELSEEKRNYSHKEFVFDNNDGTSNLMDNNVGIDDEQVPQTKGSNENPAQGFLVDSNKNNPLQKILPTTKRRLISRIAIGGMVVLSGFGVKHTFFPKKECMKWCEDHYELVDCLNNKLGFASHDIVKPYDEVEFQRKKLKICDSTCFFKNNQPVVWYDKHKGEVNCYNMDGKDPVTGDELDEITPYMVNKYFASNE